MVRCRLAAYLLWAHIHRRSKHRPLARQASTFGIARCRRLIKFRETEIEDLDQQFPLIIYRQKNILWLEIAVHNVGSMCLCQTAASLKCW